MEPAESKLLRSVSIVAILPIGGMIGCLILSALWARRHIPDEILRLAYVVRWGVQGFFVGIAIGVLLLLHGRGTLSVKRLMALVAVAAFLCWWMVAILFRVLGY
jgi:hypothetical protein